MKPIHRITRSLLGLGAAAVALAQTNPGLPYEAGETRELYGLNSFGGALMAPGIHSEQLALLPLEQDELQIRPFPRRYIVIRFYAIRPWLVHPYTGQQLALTNVFRSVGSDNPDWLEMTKGRTLAELLEPDSETGEPMVSIEDGGLVDESNEAEVMAFREEADAELRNAEAVGVNLGNPARNIIHAPYYGLYCIKIRICLPYLEFNRANAGTVWRYWVRLAYPFHQGWCWRSWWWYRLCWNGSQYVLCPYRPFCIPHAFWTRVGPDWIWHVTNPNRFRYWCLYGLRYYFTPFGGTLPLVGQLNLSLAPANGWLRYWPYPPVRYWPYRPYCTRWYWFRCLPWITYRYLPPVIQAAFAIPKPEFGAGFLPPGDGPEPFPLDPPTIGDDGRFQRSGDSFFDITFDIAGVCTVRPVVLPLGDHDGDGRTRLQDFSRPVLEEQRHAAPIDLSDADFPEEPQ